MSLADYKSLRRVSSTSTNPNSTPTTPVQQEVTTATPSIMTATPTFTNNSTNSVSVSGISSKAISGQSIDRISVKTRTGSSENSSNKSSLDLHQETEIGEDPGTPTLDEGRVLNHLSAAKPSSSIIMQTSASSNSNLNISGSGSISASVSGISSKSISGHGNLSSSHLPPSLNTLPLFEKLDKLELAQQEIKRKGKKLFFQCLLFSGLGSAMIEKKPNFFHSNKKNCQKRMARTISHFDFKKMPT